MPRNVTDVGPSNADEAKEVELLQHQGKLAPEVSSSAGTSSSASVSRPEQSGELLPDTGSSLQWHALSTESPSGVAQVPSQVQSSTAPLMGGSTQETGQDQQSPSGSSVGSAAKREAILGRSDADEARRLMGTAKVRFIAKDYAGAETLVRQAMSLDASLLSEAELALRTIATAKASAPGHATDTSGPSEEDPQSGGFVVN